MEKFTAIYALANVRTLAVHSVDVTRLGADGVLAAARALAGSPGGARPALLEVLGDSADVELARDRWAHEARRRGWRAALWLDDDAVGEMAQRTG